MNTKKLSILYYLLFILAYVGLNFTTSMYLMGYEDTWDDHNGVMWSLSTMNTKEQIAYILWYIPNFPFGVILEKGTIGLILTSIVNPLLIGFLITRIFKKSSKQVLGYGLTINSIIFLSIIVVWIFILAN